MCRMKEKQEPVEWGKAQGHREEEKESWLLHLPFPGEQDLESC